MGHIAKNEWNENEKTRYPKILRIKLDASCPREEDVEVTKSGLCPKVDSKKLKKTNTGV